MENKSRIHEYLAFLDKAWSENEVLKYLGMFEKKKNHVDNSQIFLIEDPGASAKFIYDIGIEDYFFHLPFQKITLEVIGEKARNIIFAERIGESGEVGLSYAVETKPGVWLQSIESSTTGGRADFNPDPLLGGPGSPAPRNMDVAFAMLAVLCKILECKNVSMQRVSAKPTVRSKLGKEPPLYSHHVLVVKPERSESPSLGGTHAPPRVHLRRGHIRHLSDGRTIWVRESVVGDKTRGIVTKDYLVGAQA